MKKMEILARFKKVDSDSDMSKGTMSFEARKEAVVIKVDVEVIFNPLEQNIPVTKQQARLTAIEITANFLETLKSKGYI